MDSEISSNQIKRAFSKIKEEMRDLYSRIEHLEQENKILKQTINNPQTNNRKTITKLIGNNLSGKIHLPDCPYAKKIAIQNIEEFDDIKQALRQKYKKCNCISLI